MEWASINGVVREGQTYLEITARRRQRHWRGGSGGAQSRWVSQAKSPETRGGLAGLGLGAAGWSAAGEDKDCLPAGLVYHLSLVRTPRIFFLRGSLRSEKDSNVLPIQVSVLNSKQLGDPSPHEKAQTPALKKLGEVDQREFEVRCIEGISVRVHLAGNFLF